MSACWMAEALRETIKDHGFKVECYPQKSKSGSAWFNLIATRIGNAIRTLPESHALILRDRQRQWDLWSKIEDVKESDAPGRNVLVEALDLDLQFVALTRQLKDEGVLNLALSDVVQRRVRVDEFAKKVDQLVKEDNPTGVTVTEEIHFRERGEQLTILEQFLRGDDRLAVVHGGSGSGKTTLVRRILATRAYAKAVVSVDGLKSRSVWSFIEQVFSQVGLRLAPELLSVVGDMRMSSIEPALRQFMNSYAHRTILFIDNFSSVQARDGLILDDALGALLALWASRSGAKIILASNSELVPAVLQRATGELPTSARVGRYASDQTVINVLDDKFDRKGAGLAEYPPALIAAIDRHPLIASLAAQNLQKHGVGLLVDARFVRELRLRLREELWNRLVDPENQSALEIVSQLRVPVPQTLVAKFASEGSLAAAVAAELVHVRRDDRWGELYSVLGLFRVRELRALDLDEDDSLGGRVLNAPRHAAISDAYRALYREDDDPTWIRESYFHAMLSGDREAVVLSKGLGKYYYDELIASADYSYVRRRDYNMALELYKIAEELSPLNESSAMRKASCLIRCDQRRAGEDTYSGLVQRFPDSRGIKTSHVDALLSIDDYAAAVRTLKKYELLPSDSEWIAYEWGRAYLGSDQYKQAVNIFRNLTAGDQPDAHYHVFLGRALQYSGSFEESEAALRDAETVCSEPYAVRTALGVVLEQNGKLEEAREILEPLCAERDDNYFGVASLARIYRVEGRRLDAIRAARPMLRNPDRRFAEYVRAIQIETYLADGLIRSAIDYASEIIDPSAYPQFIKVRVFREIVDMAVGPDREKILELASKLRVPSSLSENGLVQLERARLAQSLGDVGLLAAITRELGRLGVSGAGIDAGQV